MDINEQFLAGKEEYDEERKREQPFIILGFSNDNKSQYSDIYFFVYEFRRVMILKPNQLKGAHLKWVAPHDYWLKFYGSCDRRMVSGVNWREVKEQILRDAEQVGQYNGQFYSIGRRITKAAS
jgi:hypothetical protein